MSAVRANLFLSFPLMGKVGRSAAAGRKGCGAAGAHKESGRDAHERLFDWRLRRRTPSVRFADTFPIKGKDGVECASVCTGEQK